MGNPKERKLREDLDTQIHIKEIDPKVVPIYNTALRTFGDKTKLTRNKDTGLVEVRVDRIGIEDFDIKEFRINATLFDLLSAFRNVLQGVPEEQLTGMREETFTVPQKITDIMGRFKKSKRHCRSSL